MKKFYKENIGTSILLTVILLLISGVLIVLLTRDEKIVYVVMPSTEITFSESMVEQTAPVLTQESASEHIPTFAETSPTIEPTPSPEPTPTVEPTPTPQPALLDMTNRRFRYYHHDNLIDYVQFECYDVYDSEYDEYVPLIKITEHVHSMEWAGKVPYDTVDIYMRLDPDLFGELTILYDFHSWEEVGRLVFNHNGSAFGLDSSTFSWWNGFHYLVEE